MLINTPISLGELVDKISILIIKQKNITDKTKLDHVKKDRGGHAQLGLRC